MIDLRIMYIYICSDQCDSVYPDNNVYDFIIDLPRTLANPYGDLRMALVDLYLVRHFRCDGIYMLTADVLNSSPTHGSEQSVLACYSLRAQKKPPTEAQLRDRVIIQTPPSYHAIARSSVSTIRFHMKALDLSKDTDDAVPSESRLTKVYMTLHVKA